MTQPASMVVFLHARGEIAGDEAWFEKLATLGLELFSHREGPGLRKTQSTLEDFGALCREINEAAPDAALLVLRAPLVPGPATLSSLTEVLRNTGRANVVSVMSNAEPLLNPFAGLVDAGPRQGDDRAELVGILGEGVLLPVNTLPDHCLVLPAAAVSELAGTAISWDGAGAALRRHGFTVAVPDWLYLEAPGQSPYRAMPLQPHETPRPAAWAQLSARLQLWLDHPATDLRMVGAPGMDSVPVTLHITHSWGGGIARWIESFINADSEGAHLVLKAEGPQSRQGAGQRLSLYPGLIQELPLNRWWLQPPIDAAIDENPQYDAILKAICQRYGVGRIIVSSLVGHSLGSLQTGLPTLQVLHDNFPAWPLLSIHPEEYGYDLAAAMRDRRAREQFPRQSLEDWTQLANCYVALADSIKRVAPSASAAKVQSKLEPGGDVERIHIIPHGLPPLPLKTIRGQDREDGRLNLLVPGRIQSGKGAQLLAEALPALTPIAQVTLFGCGKGGEAFFGMNGVNVIIDYDRQTMSETLEKIGPHCAALLSIVPETFSYMLSELQALGIPTVTTNRGSFAERIENGINGWLIEPEPAALVNQVKELAENPGALRSVQQQLLASPEQSPEAMAEAYNTLCAPSMPGMQPAYGLGLSLAQSEAIAGADKVRRQHLELLGASEETHRLEALVKSRTVWAQDEKRRVANLKVQVGEIQDLLDASHRSLDKAHQELENRARHNAALDQEIQRLIKDFEAQLGNLQTAFDDVVNSHSWKLTRPLRVLRRLVGKFFQLKAWNPFRWPLLIAQFTRNLSTTGLTGTLRRAQHFPPQQGPDTQSAEAPVALEKMNLPSTLPCAAEPRVSIIIPAYNHFEHTAACLSSIALAECREPFEVIVVDDASTDDTRQRLASVDGLRLFSNEENLGFIGSCNRGADEAQGDYVLFLNNDTQVQPGWLDSLLGTFEEHESVGMVGARLVYPDGTLQECGGMVFQDGSGWNYGRGDNPDRPEYQAVREVDYCSGACLVLRRALFQSLGGFDRHYAPAYYEDTDLAFKIREQGLRVLVQPATTVIHFEGVSSGTDLNSGTKRYQTVNQAKFRKRWAEALKQQPRPIANPGDGAEIRRARDHRRLGRVLIIDAYTPEPDQDSGSVRLTNLMRCLDELGYGVTFFADNRAWTKDYTPALQQLGAEAWYAPWLASAEEFLRDRGEEFAHVIISRHYIAQNYITLLQRFAPQASFIFDTVDLHYLREQRLADLEDSAALRQAARLTRRSEFAMIAAADATLVVSPVEQEILAKERPEAAVFVLSNIHEVPGRHTGFEERADLYFVGGYQHPPNVDAAEWFVDKIWPRVHSQLPGVTFHLVGSKAPEQVSQLGDREGVTFHGFVESVDPFLDRCRLAVAPLRYGAGVKGKVNQAMAHGQPVVATTAAVEGIHAEHGQDVLVADNADDFAAEIIRLYQDPALWASLSEAGIVNVRAHFSKDAAKRDIAALFSALDSGED